MNQGNVSQTALKVASMMLSLNVDEAWRERLPDGLGDLTRQLLLAAEVPPYTPAADLTMQSLSDVLSNTKEWNDHAVSFVVAEGLLMYLNTQDVHALFDSVAAEVAPGSRFVFSYPLGVRRYAFSSALVRMLGEPWLSHTDKESLPGYIGDG